MTQIIPSRGGGGGVGLYKYMGTVDYYEDLPTSGMKVGDTYNVVNAHTTAPEFPAGANLAWNGEEWDVLGGTFDLSEYQKKLVEGDGIDIDQDTNEISVDTTVIATKEDLTTKQDVISDLDTIRSGAAKGATALQPNDNVSELVNDAGYLVSSDLKQSDWGQADSSAIDYIKNKPTIGNAILTIQRNGTNVNTFTANATSNVTANISVPTKTSDITNDSGFIDKDVNNLTNYTLTTSLATVATSGSYNDLSNKPSIPTKTSDLTNDSGFIDKDVNNLTNYTLSSDLAAVATSGSYNDLSNKPTIGDATIKIQKNSTDIDSFTTNATSGKTINISVPTTVAELSDSSDYALNSSLAAVATSGSYNDLSNKPTIGTANLTVQKNGTTVATFGANATSGVTANITVPTKVTDLSDAGDYAKSASLATVATTGDYDDLIDKPTIPGVINNLTSTSTTDALSAAQGKALKDALDNISGLGKFLSLWDSTTGQPISFPLATPYTYTTGDWFMVETVGTTNYKPSGSSYTGAASTTVETNDVQQGDVYIYDGTNWLFQDNNEVQVSFANLAGQPTDNANLATALGAKQDVSNMVTTLTGADNTHYPTAKAVADAITAAGGGDMLASVYDPDNIAANAFDYNNFINTPNLSAVATSGDYSDLSNTPSLATVATSGSYNDLSNKPTIPAAQIQSDWTQADNTKKDYIKNKPSLATVATTGAYSDLSGTPTLATVATSGSYNDLSNKPTIPTVNNATLTIQKNGTTVKTFTANASTDVTANISVPTKTSDITNDSGYITKSVNNLTNYTLSSALATVATTGSYTDLSNKPTIPTDTSDLTNGAGFITGITSGDVTSALGYTPYNSTNPSGYVTSSIINDTAYGSGWNADTTHAPTKNAVYDKISAMDTTISGKQATLVSGTNIKTINNTSLLGSGNIDIQTGGNYTAGNGIDITNDEIGLDGTYEGKDYSAMQGPAPDGFHVPLHTEWQAVKDIRTALGGGSSDGTNFGIALKLPFAGYRDYSSAAVGKQGSYGDYWSSSRSNTNLAYYLYLRSSTLDPRFSYNRAYGFSVRCFKNSPVIPTSSWTKLYGTSIESGGIFWSSTDGLISLSSDGTTWITIADKNLGATTVWNSGNTLSEANCGKYYQWGNNYGFPRTGTIANQSTTQVDASSYGPGNYYSSDTFIKYSGRWDTTDNGNLWGGVTGIQAVSGNLVLGDKLYKIVTSTTAPASGTASNIITIVTD